MRLIAGSTFSTPAYVYEPVGAAYYYAQRLKSDALVLVADFGGGTSDFSLIRFGRPRQPCGGDYNRACRARRGR